jgi:hypothetical protein
MDEEQDGEYAYSISRGSAGAGMRVWRWAVRHRDGAAPIHQGTSIRSREDARRAALAVIARLKQGGGASSGSDS